MPLSALPRSKTYQWIASLYFFQSIPFVVISLIATLMYQSYHVENAEIVLLISLLMLPWAIKPFFAPLLEKGLSKKRLTLLAQSIMALLFLVMALFVERSSFLFVSVLCFTGLAFTSSLHDIVSDGLYLLHLDEQGQKKYVALRTLCYQMGRLLIKGALLVLVAKLAWSLSINPWQLFFFILFALGLLLTVYHYYKLPEGRFEKQAKKTEYLQVFKQLLSHKTLLPALAFIFFYNISDGQLQKIIPLYLIDKAGLDLSLSQVGVIYGLVGSAFLMLGVFIGGFLMHRYSLKSAMIFLTTLVILGPMLFLILDNHQTPFIYLTLVLTQLTAGMANAVYMGYILSVANKTDYPMTAYTLCTAIMAFSYVFFGALSGFVEQALGYSHFFIYILAAHLLLIVVTIHRMQKDV